MKEPYIGSHNRTSTSILEAIKEIKQNRGNVVQIFLIPPGSREIDKIPEFDEVKNYIKANNIILIIHSSYMHNFARHWDSYSWWLKNLELELINAHRLGASGVVLHFGKSLDLSKQEAYNNMYTSLIYVINKTKDTPIKILLETSTGQGSEMCYKLEDLAYFYRKFSKNPNKLIRDRVKLCIDTCHIFSAGYDIRTSDKVKLFLETFEELIGLRHVCLIHLNDSRVDIGAQVDRHANLGRGYIGFVGLQSFFNYFKKLGIPMLLETPDHGYVWEIPKLLHE